MNMAKRIATKRKTVAQKRSPLKDPKGGLTAAGRAAYRAMGANLRPGVKGPADTPEKMRRKGSFLRRHFANPQGPMIDGRGEPTRLALSAHAWGEPVPKTMADAKTLADKGKQLLEQYHATKKPAIRATRKKSSLKKTSVSSAAAPQGSSRRRMLRKSTGDPSDSTQKYPVRG